MRIGKLAAEIGRKRYVQLDKPARRFVSANKPACNIACGPDALHGPVTRDLAERRYRAYVTAGGNVRRYSEGYTMDTKKMAIKALAEILPYAIGAFEVSPEGDTVEEWMHAYCTMPEDDRRLLHHLKALERAIHRRDLRLNPVPKDMDAIRAATRARVAKHRANKKAKAAA